MGPLVPTLNERQSEFYDSRLKAKRDRTSSEEAAGIITNVWTQIRKNIQSFDEDLSLDQHYTDLHRQWVAEHNSGWTVDLGCFDGNLLSLELAGAAEKYTGVDLSREAIGVLQSKLDEAGYAHAEAVAGDFFQLGIPDSSVDLVYARGVLHHFEDPAIIADEVFRILKPGAVCVSLDPLATAPENRLARAAYRPFQSDSAWEFPFSKQSLEVFEQRFEITNIRGIRGLSKAGLLVSSLGATKLGATLGQKGETLDRKFASENGPYMRMLCWNVLMQAQKPL